MHLERYLNSTWEQWSPLPLDQATADEHKLTADDAKLFHSTATSALGTCNHSRPLVWNRV